jgi:hypothetical protein
MELTSAAQLLGNLGEFFGSVAVIATLVYLAVQIRTARSEADANSFNSTNSNSIGVQTAFLQQGDIWAKGNAGEKLTRDEEFAFDTLTSLRADHAFFGYRRSEALKNERERIHAINLAAFFIQYPLAYERWLKGEVAKQRLRQAAGWTPRADFLRVVEESVELMKANAV